MARLNDFHFSRIFYGDQPAVALARHEHYLFSFLHLKPGMRVLHIGCGSGRATFELANVEYVSVVGIDPDPSKIKKAEELSAKSRLANRVTFVQASLTEIQKIFHQGTFDAVFAIESTKSAPSFQSVYDQVAHVLKPEGRVAIFEWCWTPAFDIRNDDHCRLAEILEDAAGIEHREPSERTIESALRAFQSASFDLLCHEDLTLRGRSTYPWYMPLEKALSDSMAVWASEDQPQGVFGDITKRIATLLCQAGRYQLITPMAFFSARLRPAA